jgi:hypothetical protein
MGENWVPQQLNVTHHCPSHVPGHVSSGGWNRLLQKRGRRRLVCGFEGGPCRMLRS